MLKGRFGDTSGRPYIEAHILPPRLEKSGNVSFLFDTGADTSLLMPLDAQRIGIDYRKLTDKEQSLGIGGVSENFVESAYLAFAGDDEIYGYEIELRICKPSQEVISIASLLGRDIIDQWRVIYDKSGSRLDADVISSDTFLSLER